MDNLRTPASRSSMDRIRRLQKTITVLLPELAGMLERTGATMHLELTQGAQFVPCTLLNHVTS